jgi:NAD(P)H-hydrate epimerase
MIDAAEDRERFQQLLQTLGLRQPPNATARTEPEALEKAAAWTTVLLAKGPYTVIADPTGWLAVLPVATAALATAGTGDVLAGTIAGLLAQGLDPFRAACVGAWLHGAAGLRCAEAMGNTGVLASDLLPQLPPLIRALRQ